MEKECTYDTGCWITKVGSMPEHYPGICEDEECKYYIAVPPKAEGSPSNSSVLLSCRRWHVAEVVALKTIIADENADDSATARSIRQNFRCKIAQHETFIKALASVTT